MDGDPGHRQREMGMGMEVEAAVFGDGGVT